MIVIFIIPALLLLAWLSQFHYPRAVAITVFLIPTFLIRLQLYTIPTNLLELIIVTVAVVGLLRSNIRRQWYQRLRDLPRPAVVLIILFGIAALMSTAISAVPSVSLGILKGWIVMPLLLGWLVYSGDLKIVPPQRDLAHGGKNWSLKIAQALIASGVVSALLSLTQVESGSRLRGIYDVPNSLALWLAPIIVLAIWPLLRRPQFSIHHTHVQLAAAGVMLAALLLTQSIMGLASVILALGIGSALWLRGKQRWLSVASLAGFTGLALIYLGLTGKVAYVIAPLTDPEVHNSVSVRQQLWSVSWELIKEHPLLGVGLGQFEPHYQQELHQRFREYVSCPRLPDGQELSVVSCPAAKPLPEFVFRDPHNWILSFWLNTGLLGLLGFIGLNVWLLYQARHQIQKQPLVLALSTILIFGLVDTIYWKNDLSALYWVVAALLLHKPEALLHNQNAT